MPISLSLRGFPAHLRSLGSAGCKQHEHRARRLILEQLENRIALTNNVWTGIAAAQVQDYSWSNGNNWSEGTPSNGESLIFPAHAYIPAHALDNDISGGSYASIEIDSPGYTLSGNAITLTGSTGIFTTYGSGVSTYNMNTTLDGSGLSISGGGQLNIDSTVSRTDGVALSGGGTLSGDGNVPALAVEGSVVTPGLSGSGRLDVTGSGSMDADSTFTPTITSSGGNTTLEVNDEPSNPYVLNEPTLSLNITPGYSPAPGTQFQVIEGVVAGQFHGLAEGSYVFTPSGPIFRITYDLGVELTTVSPTTIQTTVQGRSSTSVFGQNLTFTATVAQSVGTPTGTVTFADAATGTTLATVNLNSSGVAVCTTSALAVGQNAITASYSGDTRFAPSISPALSETVTQDTTSTTITPSANPSVYGQNVNFTAKVLPASPGGELPPEWSRFTTARPRWPWNSSAQTLRSREPVRPIRPTRCQLGVMTFLQATQAMGISSPTCRRRSTRS